MDEVRARSATGVGDPGGAERVDEEGAVGIALTGVDLCPGAGVDDDVGVRAQDGLVHGVAVAEVERPAVAGDHLVARLAARAHELMAELAACTRDEDAHQPLALSGRHHHSLARYHSTVAASASSSERSRRQPSAVILLMSTE